MWYVYILKSVKTERFYVGQTENLKKRFEQHNSGKTQSLKAYLPFEIVRVEEFSSKQEACRRERKIKSYKGGVAFKRLLN